MAGTPITRLALRRAGHRLGQVHQGAGLLRKKREALVRELFAHAAPASDLRGDIADQAERVWPKLLDTLALEGTSGLEAAAWPFRTVTVEVTGRTVWGIGVSEILEPPVLRRSLEARALTPAFAASAIATGVEMETLVELLLRAAGRESLLRRLGDSLRRTSRQVQTLERRLAPALESEIHRIRGTLEEREREEHGRLRRLRRARS